MTSGDQSRGGRAQRGCRQVGRRKRQRNDSEEGSGSCQGQGEGDHHKRFRGQRAEEEVHGERSAGRRRARKGKQHSCGFEVITLTHIQEVCERCTRTKSRTQVPCGGPRAYSATKISCARCVKDKQWCSFGARREVRSKGKGKRKTRDEEEDRGEGSSRTSRTSGTRSDEEEDEERKKRRRIKKRGPFERQPGEELEAWLARSYAELGLAKAQVSRAKKALKREKREEEDEEDEESDE